jgi:hypothetical protein
MEGGVRNARFIGVKPGSVECEACGDLVDESDVDEAGNCEECVATGVEAAANDRYWKSMRL